MPGGAKSTVGYTKAAQKQKFIRNRDLKLKESELQKEEHVKRIMCEGICKRCREKVQWRFKYDKYKSLRTPGTCSACKQRKITKAYRTFCDDCASNRKVCSSCCVDLTVDPHSLSSVTAKMEEHEIQIATLGEIVPGLESGIAWDEKKFHNIAASKYSKARPVEPTI
eukprot:gene13322-17853_t